MKNLFLLCALMGLCHAAHCQEITYEHHSIAILPFKIGLSNRQINKDTNFLQIKENELQQGFELQEAFYNSLMEKKKKFYIAIQDYKVTDSILKLYRFNPENIPWMNKTILAKVLGVDAVFLGMIESAKSRVANDFLNPDMETIINVKIFDGKTGNLVWSRDDRTTGGILTAKLRFRNSLCKWMVSYFPYRK